MMNFKNINELKSFLKWCRSEKMQQVTIGDMTFVFSGLAMVDSDTANNDSTLVDLPEPVADDEEMLFWSSGPAPKRNKD